MSPHGPRHHQEQAAATTSCHDHCLVHSLRVASGREAQASSDPGKGSQVALEVVRLNRAAKPCLLRDYRLPLTQELLKLEPLGCAQHPECHAGGGILGSKTAAGIVSPISVLCITIL